jgi:hypothetical protein
LFAGNVINSFKEEEIAVASMAPHDPLQTAALAGQAGHFIFLFFIFFLFY